MKTILIIIYAIFSLITAFGSIGFINTEEGRELLKEKKINSRIKLLCIGLRIVISSIVWPVIWTKAIIKRKRNLEEN